MLRNRVLEAVVGVLMVSSANHRALARSPVFLSITLIQHLQGDVFRNKLDLGNKYGSGLFSQGPHALMLSCICDMH